MVKKKILKIVSIILICCFLLFPCFGLSRCESKQDLEDLRNEGLLDPDESLGDDDQSEDDETESLYGVKVLYRPDSYDYNLSSGGTAEEENDYYGKYAWYIIFNLFQTFGIVNTTYNQYITYGTNLNVPQQAKDILNGNLYYLLYDSIRYHVNIIGKINNDSSNEDEDEVYYLVGADTASRWKWSFNYKLDNINDGNGRNLSSYISNNKNENNVYNKIKAFNTLYNYYTNNTWYQTTYKSTFVSSSSSTSEEEQAKDYKNYSDYTKTLEYVIYCYSLDLEPHEVTVEIVNNEEIEEQENPDLYKVNIEGYESVDEALAFIKDLFQKTASYVGLIDRQINNLKNWIKHNVIGEKAMANDQFTYYDNVTETIDNGTTSYDLGTSSSTVQFGRNYSEVVDNIVDNVCDLVSIGENDDGTSVTIKDRFLASQIKEFTGFSTGDDALFQPDSTYQPLEYQSVVLLYKHDIELTETSDYVIAIKYDADLDGTNDGWHQDKYIDVIVELNYYNHDHNKMFTLASDQVRVYDGPFEEAFNPLEHPEYSFLPADHGLAGLTPKFSDPELQSILQTTSTGERGIVVHQFNRNIGGGILNTEMKGGMSVNPITLLGTTNVRKYYSIVEPPINEDLGDRTYITGRLNSEMFAGADGSDYLEITYKVLKKKGDRTTNYKFYTSLYFEFT